jgi:hypothetical protein
MVCTGQQLLHSLLPRSTTFANKAEPAVFAAADSHSPHFPFFLPVYPLLLHGTFLPTAKHCVLCSNPVTAGCPGNFDFVYLCGPWGFTQRAS